jgi:uncharacterized protein
VAGVTAHRGSAIYAGTVRHRRRRPVAHAFRYRTYHLLIDVDELPELDRTVWGLGYNRRGLTSFHDRDHLGRVALPVREKLRRWLAGEGVALPDGPVRVLTNLRVLGHVFNPVSWWFCHHPDGQLAFVVAEVNNTFGESHLYLLDELQVGPDGLVRATARKAFHVSPFLPIDGLTYRFTFQPAAERVLAHMDVEDAHGKLFDATQAGRRRPLTTRTLTAALFRYPLTTVWTVVAIHRQALSLWRKRVPFFRKPEPPENGLGRVLTPLPSPPQHERVGARHRGPQERAS